MAKRLISALLALVLAAALAPAARAACIHGAEGGCELCALGAECAKLPLAGTVNPEDAAELARLRETLDDLWPRWEALSPQRQAQVSDRERLTALHTLLNYSPTGTPQDPPQETPVVLAPRRMAKAPKETPYTTTGGLTITGGVKGTDWEYETDVYGSSWLSIKSETPITVSGNSTNEWIEVDASVADAHLTIQDLTINRSASGACIFGETGSTINLTLVGTNTLTSTFSTSVSVRGSKFVIGGEGTLTAKGSRGGIGNIDRDVEIIINNGTVNAEATKTGFPAIGTVKAATIVTINGGHVTAKASSGAAIGNGSQSGTATSSTTVNINGGYVNATAGQGAGIGTGTGIKNAPTININGNAVVFAKSESGDPIGVGASSEATPTKNLTKGIVFEGNNGTVYGDVTLDQDLEIPEHYTLTIPAGAKLTIPDKYKVTNKGNVILNGTVVGEKNIVPNSANGIGKESVTDTSITLTHVEGAEYSKDGGATWQKSNVFDGLTPATAYPFVIKTSSGQSGNNNPFHSGTTATYYTAYAKPSNGDGFTFDWQAERVLTIDKDCILWTADSYLHKLPGESLTWEIDSANRPTLYAQREDPNTNKVIPSSEVLEIPLSRPAAPAGSEGYDLDYVNETVTNKDGYEISTDGVNFQMGTIAATPGMRFYVRKAATDEKPCGNSLQTNALGPDNAGRGDPPDIKNITKDMEYRPIGGSQWTSCTDGMSLPKGDYEVRYKATQTAFASKSAYYTNDYLLRFKDDFSTYELSITDRTQDSAQFKMVPSNERVRLLGLSVEGPDAAIFSVEWPTADNPSYYLVSDFSEPRVYTATLVATYDGGDGTAVKRAECPIRLSVYGGKFQAPPPALTLASDPTGDTIVVNAVPIEGKVVAEYSIDGGRNWQTSPVFTGLSPATAYSVWARYAQRGTGNDLYAPSALRELAVTTDKGAQNPPEVPALQALGWDSVTLTPQVSLATQASAQFSIDGGVTWQSSNVFTGLNPAQTYTFCARFAETAQYYASQPGKPITLTTDKAPQPAPEPPKDPVAQPDTDTTVTVKPLPPSEDGGQPEYSVDGGKTWQSSPTFTNLAPGETYELWVRYGATDTQKASDPVLLGKVTIPGRPAADPEENAEENPRLFLGNPFTGDNIRYALAVLAVATAGLIALLGWQLSKKRRK